MVIHRLRLFHAGLAVLAVGAYATADDDIAHYLLGYAVAMLVFVRLLWSLTGVPPLGLMKYYPHFSGLRLGGAMTHPAISRLLLLSIALSLILTVSTGIFMDGGHTIGFGDPVLGPHKSPKWVEEVHELGGNLVLGSVALHVTYLLIWKRQLALFMLFLGGPNGQRRRPREPGSD
jgi:cytochrome b